MDVNNNSGNMELKIKCDLCEIGKFLSKDMQFCHLRVGRIKEKKVGRSIFNHQKMTMSNALIANTYFPPWTVPRFTTKLNTLLLKPTKTANAKFVPSILRMIEN